MRKVKILLAVVALAMAACSGGSEPAEITVSDAETGSAEEVSVETESSEETVTTDTDEPEKEEGESEQAEVEDEPVQPTPTAESTPTVEPTPTLPEPTVEPVDEETRERAGQVYSMLVMAQAAAELLNETAIKSQEGELEGFEWFGTTLVIGALGSVIDESQEEIDPPEPLKQLADDTFELNGMARDILARWYDEEIYAEDVILELEPILFHLEDVLSSAEVVMEEEYGVDASELAKVREELVEELATSLDSAGEDGALEAGETQDVEKAPASIIVSDESIEISGIGPAVSENFELDRCYKAVFQSTVSGRGFSTVELHSIDEGDYRSVAIGGDDVSQIELEGGTYFVAVETDDGVEWTVRGECQSTDEQLAEVAPAADPASEIFLELEGTGPTVSDNIALNSCYKGVFFTEVSGSGFSTVELHSIDEGDYRSIAIGGDDVSQIELEDGTFFLAVDVEDGAEWSIRGECQSTDEQLAEVAPAADPIPEVFLELEGTGPTVSENIALSSCYKTVFFTSISGSGFSTVELHSIDEGDYRSIAIGGDDVSQVEMDGGVYFVVVDAEDGAEWTIRGECQSTDEQLAEVAPAADPIPEVFLELEGIGPNVSDNISLSSCYKGVFSTTVAGDGFSTVELHSIDEGDYRSVAIGGDDVSQIELEDGIYFVVVDAEDGEEWSVRGECQSTDKQLAEVAPAADPISEVFLELEGIGPSVSDNISLSSCYKGVFSTTVAGDGFSTVEFHSIDEGDYRSIAIGGDDVNQIELEGGIYFVVVDAEDGDEWTVKGECGD